MTVSINGTSGLVFNDGSTQATGGYIGFRNRIINGDMKIDQRNAGAAITGVTGSTSAFPVDRMRVTNFTDGQCTVQQSIVAPAGFVNSTSLTVTTADASLGATQYCQVAQRIEGLNLSDLSWGTAAAASINFSFWVRASVTGTYCVGFYNSAGNRSYTSEYTINAANTWEHKSITIAGDTTGTWLTTNGLGLNAVFCLAVGSSYQQAAGSWGTTSFAIGTSAQTNLMATNGATFYITGVQLEKGSTATPFEVRPYGTELALCQRYFQIYNSPNNFSSWGAGRQTSTTGSRIFANYPAMRSSPTAAIGGGVSLDYPNGSTAITAITAQFLSTSGGLLDVSHEAVGAVGYGVGLQMASSGLSNFFSLSSEL